MGTDKNTLSFAGERPLGVKRIGDVVAKPGESDALKVTDCDYGMIFAGTISGGKEDCVDVNNKCHDIEIFADLFVVNGKYLATIKGGSSRILLVGEVKGHGSEVDVDIGNVADQSDNLTRQVKLALKHVDGDPITVRVLGGERPIILNPFEQEYRIVFEVPGRLPKSWFLKAYKFLKRLGLPI